MPLAEQGKNKCIVGLVLKLIGTFIPLVGGLIGFIGDLIVLFGIKDISEAAKHYRPFYFYLFGVILGFFLGIFILANQGALISMASNNFAGLWFLTWLLVLLFGGIQAAVWFDLEKITKVSTFKTAGILTITGAVLFVVIVGAFFLLAAYIVLIVAFSQIPNYLGPVKNREDKYQAEIFAEHL